MHMCMCVAFCTPVGARAKCKINGTAGAALFVVMDIKSKNLAKCNSTILATIRLFRSAK